MILTHHGMNSLFRDGLKDYLQITNIGRSASNLTMQSRTAGMIYIGGQEIVLPEEVATTVLVPAGESVKIVGYAPSRKTSTEFSSEEGTEFTVDRFDNTSIIPEFGNWVGLVAITSWKGAGNWKDLGYLCSGTPNLRSIPSSWKGLTKLTNMGAAFPRCTSLQAIPDSWEGLEKVTNANSAFRGCTNLRSIPNSWSGLSSLLSLSYTFEDCTSLTSIPTTWNGLSRVSSINYAFKGCTSLTAIPTSWSGLNSVKNMSYAFQDCTSLVSGGTSDYTTLAGVTNTYCAFKNCINWEGDSMSLYTYLRNKSTSVSNSENTFLYCFKSVDWAHVPYYWGGQNVPDSIPEDCLEIHFNTRATIAHNLNGTVGIYKHADTRYEILTDDRGFFPYRTRSFTAGDIIYIWGFTRKYYSESMLYSGFELNPNSDYTDWWDMEIRRFYSGCDTYKGFFAWRQYQCKLKIDSWDGLGNADDISIMFRDFAEVELPETGFVGLESVTKMDRTFFGVKILNMPNSWSGLNNVTNIEHCFERSRLKYLPSSWNGLSKVTTMGYAFSGNPEITALPSSWEGLGSSSGVAVFGAFSGMASLTTIPTTGIGNIKFTQFNSVFSQCYNVTNAYQVYQLVKDKSSIYSHMYSFWGCESDSDWNQIPNNWGGPDSSDRYIDVTVKVSDTTYNPYSANVIYSFLGDYKNYYMKDEGVIGGNRYWKLRTRSIYTSNRYYGNIFDLTALFDGVEITIDEVTGHNLTAGTWEFANISVPNGYAEIYTRGVGNGFAEISTSALSSLNSMQPKYATCGFQNLSHLKTIPALDMSQTVYVDLMFKGCRNVESGILAMYNHLSSISTITTHSDCFKDCGVDTVTGAAELEQIPADWGGTAAT